MYYKATIINTVWCWNKGKHMDNWVKKLLTMHLWSNDF
jgi:hypothetical protein